MSEEQTEPTTNTTFSLEDEVFEAPDDMFRAIVKARVGANYSKSDRYRDFRHVFLGSHEGQRVLYQIFALGDMYANPYKSGQPSDVTAFNCGRLDVVQKIWSVLNYDPIVLEGDQNRTNRKDDEDVDY
jgi:hypothetical protein